MLVQLSKFSSSTVETLPAFVETHLSPLHQHVDTRNSTRATDTKKTIMQLRTIYLLLAAVLPALAVPASGTAPRYRPLPP